MIFKKNHGPPADRAVRAHLNKLTQQNYNIIVIKIRAALTPECVELVLEKVLQKAYSETSHRFLYIRLIKDLCGEMKGDERDAAWALVATAVRKTHDGLAESLVFPATSPTHDYNLFCEVGRRKREVLGRCETHVGLSQCDGMGGAHGAGLDDIYDVYVSSLCTAAQSASEADCDVDAEAKLETLLDCVAAVLTARRELRTAFRAVARSHRLSGCGAGKRSRFKLRDMIGQL